MFKNVTRGTIYKGIFYIFLILIFTISISKPFLTSSGHDLYIYHIFNQTDVPFDGTINNLYVFPIIVLTYLTLLATIIPKFDHNLKYKIVVETIKLTVFFMYLFAIINYFRVIYPDSFLIDFTTSNLYSGLYIFVIFLICYLIMIIIDLVELNHELLPYRHLFDISEKASKIKRRLVITNRVFIFFICFSFVSLLFVPFYINFTQYMPEPGFEHILDLRTSVDYYLLSIFDNSFSLTIPAIILIYAVVTSPVLLLLKDDEKSIYKIIANMFFIFLLTIFALAFGLGNRGFIEPILILKLNGVAIFFITLILVSTLVVITSASFILYINKKEARRNVELDSL